MFTVSCFSTNECWDWVGSPASCRAGPGFKYQPRDLSSWLGFYDFPQLFQDDTWSYVTMASFPVHFTSLFTGHLYCLLVCSLHFYLVFVITCAERQKSLILFLSWKLWSTHNFPLPPSLSLSLSHTHTYTQSEIRSAQVFSWKQVTGLGVQWGGDGGGGGCVTRIRVNTLFNIIHGCIYFRLAYGCLNKLRKKTWKKPFALQKCLKIHSNTQMIDMGGKCICHCVMYYCLWTACRSRNLRVVWAMNRK